MTARPTRVGIVADLREEGWASMDLVADMLMSHLPAQPQIEPVRVEAPFHHRFGRWRHADAAPAIVDRIINRFVDYPRWLRAQGLGLDVYHLVDHSYAHLVDSLPPDRTVVTCHDVDAFRSLLDGHNGESHLPRWLSRRVLAGFRRARVVTCVSDATRSELAAGGLVDPDRLIVVPNGVHPSCSPAPDADADRSAEMLTGTSAGPLLLHVGTTAPRKRVDVLLDATARLSASYPGLRLIRVGGPLTDALQRQAATLGIADRIVELSHVSRAVLAAVYRRADLVLMPSEREGFGLPLTEALACGTPVVASDIPALREVAGDAVRYVPPGDPLALAQAVGELIDQQRNDPTRWAARREAGIVRARRFSWAAGAARMAEIYRMIGHTQS